MMPTTLLTLTLLAPLVASFLALGQRGRWSLPIAPLPALACVWLLPSDARLELPWLMLGGLFGMDETTRLFLLLTALLWLAASLALVITPKAAHDPRLRLFFGLTMTGNISLVVSLDMLSFYLGFSLMGLAAYALVIHRGTEEVRRAGRIYLVMTLIGEMALFAGFALLYQQTGSLAPTPGQLALAAPLPFWLLSFAFAIKAGAFGVHVWLPLAHPAAPIPASAVLSGAMIKTALLGWLRFLPVGQPGLADLGTTLSLLGALGVLFAIPCGLVQTNPKVLLAYSSISKMGTLLFILGLALLVPALAPALVLVLILYAVHHALVKGALFLGLGNLGNRFALPVLALPALIMVGFPGTSGAIIKQSLKVLYGEVPLLLSSLATTLITLSTVGTTLLMGRFLYLAHHSLAHYSSGQRPQPALACVPPLLLTVVSLGLAWLGFFGDMAALSLAGSLPLLVGLLLVALLLRWPSTRLAHWQDRIPPGDMLALLPHLHLQSRARLAVARMSAIMWQLLGRLQQLSPPYRLPDVPLALAGLLWLGVLLGLFTGFLIHGR